MIEKFVEEDDCGCKHTRYEDKDMYNPVNRLPANVWTVTYCKKHSKLSNEKRNELEYKRRLKECGFEV